MEQNMTCPRLCGGTFFTLLQNAMKRGARVHSFGYDRAQLTGPHCLIGLLKVAEPKYMPGPRSTFDTNTTQYRKCALSSNTYLPFNDEQWVAGFDNEMKNNYSAPLVRMSEFTEFFIDGSVKGEWLVKAIIELIQKDESILKEDAFYITPDGVPTLKTNIVSLHDFLLPAFLLGVWHFILMNRRDNTVGQSTFISWHTFGAKGSVPKFVSSIGNNPELMINVIEKAEIVCADDETSDVEPSGGASFDYSDYLKKLEDKNKNVKTLLYVEPHPFSELYVCNNVTKRVVEEVDHHYEIHSERIEDLTIAKLRNVTNFAILCGTGGLGKSMMMRNLLLNAIKTYPKTQCLPVFISLKDYTSDIGDITDFLYAQICMKISDYPKEEFVRMLGTGKFILLLDGLDEINSGVRGLFENKLDNFSDTYDQNLIVVSSRPYSNFVHLSRFCMLLLQPFTKKQALTYIEKLDYNPEVKTKFYNELNNSLFHLHKDFTENPLLLTIMLMTYEEFADIPSKIHNFYDLAYQYLSRRHDADKDGLYKRVMRTGLSPDRYRTYLEEFCAISYMDEKYNLTNQEATEYLQIVKDHIATEEEQNLQLADFMDDLCNSLCLMYEDSGRYYFTHRSFQEYFAALFMSNLMDDQLRQIGEFFEEHGIPSMSLIPQRSDKTFSMLFDMRTKKIEKYILRPYLEDLFDKCDAGNGYWTYLELGYGNISLEGGNVSSWHINSPASFLLDFILYQYEVGEQDLGSEAPYDSSFIDQVFVFGCDEDGKSGLIGLKEDELYEDQEAEGWSMIVDPDQLYKHKNLHKELYDYMNDDQYPLKQEYSGLRALLERFKKEQDKPTRNLHDLFKR